MADGLSENERELGPVMCGHWARELSQEEKERLDRDTRILSPFQRDKLEREARRHWDLFYKRNSTHFFKDRHWTWREFGELCELGKDDTTENQTWHVDETLVAAPKRRRVLLEVGCGVGNFIFPLIEQKLDLFILACDFSPRAIQFVKDNPLYDDSLCQAFQCDITAEDELVRNVVPDSVDVASLVFVLSSIHPDKMAFAIQNICKVLRSGGLLVFRDYGLFDQAMLRFAPGHKIADNFYARQDGTRAYYFSEELVTKLFTESGFHVESCSYVRRNTVNIKENLSVPRIFVQGKFRKI